jgi:hypothetical protein
MWIASQTTASASGGSITSSTHQDTFGGFTVEVQTTAGDTSEQVPATVYVQVTRA